METLLVCYGEHTDLLRFPVRELKRLLDSHPAQEQHRIYQAIRQWFRTQPSAPALVGNPDERTAMDLAAQNRSTLLVLVGTLDELEDIPSLAMRARRYGADAILVIWPNGEEDWSCTVHEAAA